MSFTQQEADELIASFQTDSEDRGGYFTDVANNAPDDALNAMSDFIAPFLSPIETAETIGDLGKGLYSLLTGGDAPEEQLAIAIGDYYVERYGSAEAVKNSFRTEPVTTAMDLLSVINPAAATVKASGKAVRKASKTDIAQKIGDKVGADVATDFIDRVAVTPIKQTAKKLQENFENTYPRTYKATRIAGKAAGVALDPSPAVVRGAEAAANTAGNIVASTGGFLSGQPLENVNAAFRVGADSPLFSDRVTQFMQTMREGPNAVTDAEFVGAATEGLKNLKRQNSAQYQADRANVDLTVKDPNAFSGILAKVDELKREDIQSKPGAGIKGGKEQVQVFNEIRNAVNEFAFGNDQSLEALHDLRVRIDRIKIDETSDQASDLRRLRNEARSAVVDRLNEIPGYQEMNRRYSDVKKLTDEIESELSLGNTKNISQKLRKLQSITRNNVSTNFGRRADLLSAINTDQPFDLIEVATARALSPRQSTGIQRVGQGLASAGGLAGFIDPLLAVASTAASPRNVGSAAYATGRVARYPMAAYQATRGILPSAIRTSVAAERAGILGVDPQQIEDQRELDRLLSDF